MRCRCDDELAQMATALSGIYPLTFSFAPTINLPTGMKDFVFTYKQILLDLVAFGHTPLFFFWLPGAK